MLVGDDSYLFHSSAAVVVVTLDEYIQPEDEIVFIFGSQRSELVLPVL